MTLDEAIKHCEEKAEELNHEVKIWVHCPNDPNKEKDIKDFEDCKKCAEEHRQLAEWLKELKRLQSLEVRQDTYEENDVLFSYHEMMGLCSISVCTPVSTEWIKYTIDVGVFMSHNDFVEWCKNWIKENKND